MMAPSPALFRAFLPGLCCLALAWAPLARAAEVEFNRDVRPILSDACFACHGPDKGKRKGGLRLDTEEGGRKVVVPGKAAESELLRRLTTADEKDRMPPARANRRLTDAQVEVIRRWVDQGAKWEKH